MQRFAIYLIAIVGGVAFLVLVKLMYDMTSHMGLMTGQVSAISADLARMRDQMEGLTGDVAKMRESVASLATDVGGMRAGVESMAGVVRSGGEQIEKLNPMDMLQRVLPPGGRP